MWYYGVLLVICSTYLVLFCLQRSLKRLPPGPIGLPIFGNLLHLGSKPNESLRILSKKYGPLMSIFLGAKTVVVVSSPEMAKEALKTHDKDFGGRLVFESSRVLDHHKRSIIVAQQGPHWRMLRRFSTADLLSPKKLADLRPLRRQQIRQTVAEVAEKSGQTMSIDVRDLSQRSILSLLGKMIFSEDMFDTDSQDFSEFKDTLSKGMEAGGRPNIVDFLPILRGLDPQRVFRDTEFYTKKVHGMIECIIQDRLSCPDHRNDFLSALLDLSGPDFTVSDIQHLLMDLLGAGSDTTTITVEWAMAQMIRNPYVMTKVQQELDAIVGKERILEEDDIERLPYLKAVVKETLRLHPPAPFLVPRTAEREIELAGFSIPKDAALFVNFWAIGRDPSVWSEPDEFMPDRFIARDLDFKGHHFEYVPFGAGRRICVGMPLASVMVHSLLGALIQCFDWSSVRQEQIDMSDRFGVTLHKKSPLIALAVPRLPLSAYHMP